MLTARCYSVSPSASHSYKLKSKDFYTFSHSAQYLSHSSEISIVLTIPVKSTRLLMPTHTFDCSPNTHEQNRLTFQQNLTFVRHCQR